jgi:hypothetical protein
MEKCVTCHFYDRRGSRGLDGRGARSGQCRRSAPMLSPVTTKAYQIEGVWPTVRDDDWCGEWKILPRRPAEVPAHQAAVATVTSLVAASLTASCDLADDILLPAAARLPSAIPESALTMAAD